MTSTEFPGCPRCGDIDRYVLDIVARLLELEGTLQQALGSSVSESESQKVLAGKSPFFELC